MCVGRVPGENNKSKERRFKICIFSPLFLARSGRILSHHHDDLSVVHAKKICARPSLAQRVADLHHLLKVLLGVGAGLDDGPGLHVGGDALPLLAVNFKTLKEEQVLSLRPAASRLCDASCVVYRVWCVVCGVWCVVCGAWC